MFLHPALDLPLIQVASLLPRADPRASALLTDAARLARDRITRDAHLRDALVELDAPPFIGSPRSTYATPQQVTQSDLLLAFLGSEDAATRALPFAGATPDPDALQELVSRARARCARAEPAVSGGLDQTLELPWSARHALDALAGNDAPIGVESLLGALEPRAWLALGQFTQDYVEGLWTAEEAAERLRGPYLERRLPALGELYVDRHRGVEALDRALRDAGMAWITGHAGSGRGALASAWIARLAYRLGPPELEGMRPGIAWHGLGSGPEPDAFGPAHGIGLDPVVHVLIRPDDGSRRGPARARAGEATLTGGAGALEKLTPAELRAILEAIARRPDVARALIVCTSEEREKVCRAVPEAAAMPVVEVPPIADADRLLLWVAAIPHVRLPGGALPHVSTMVAGFAAATEGERAERSPEAIERALARGRVSMGDGAELVLQALVGARRGRALRPREQPAVERFLGSEERLHAVAAFEQRWTRLLG